PSGGSMAIVGGYFTALSVAVTFANGTDAASGVATGRLLQRQSATWSASACGAYGAFSTVATDPASSPYSDSTVASGTLSANIGETSAPLEITVG
ncbi:MAG: hypothetical protein AAB320_08365, partial [Elusimicrobiota bacterium]